MGYQESGEVLTRGRNVEKSVLPRQEIAAGAENAEPFEKGHFTARNAEFDRRRVELKKQMARDRAAAEAELLRLSGRCDTLKEFIFDTDTAAEELENLNAIIHAEKEFASRMEQLEIRYYRSYGKYSDHLYKDSGSSSARQESALPLQYQSGIRSSLPLIGAVIFSAIIIALSMAIIFL